MPNAIHVICPYMWEGLWVFDDPAVGLRREPFVAGMDAIISAAVEAKGIPDARRGFRLIFSAVPFPGHDLELVRLRAESGGHWYRAEALGMEGWLCPALDRYFDAPPPRLYARIEPR